MISTPSVGFTSVLTVSASTRSTETIPATNGSYLLRETRNTLIRKDLDFRHMIFVS